MESLNKKIKITSSIGLQIDNLVYNKHGEYHAIRANDFSRFNHPDMGGDYGIYAIKLSPEILEKCGFVPVNAGSTFWSAFMESENKHFISAEYHSNGDLNIRDLRDSRFAVKNILYLHQLQNLIYSLTGEEITIKL